MSNRQPQFEYSDNAGTTTQVSGTVGTTPISIPSPAGNAISQFVIVCKIDQPRSNRLLVYADQGSDPITLRPGGSYSLDLKGSPTQIDIQGNVAGVEYEAVFNREP